MCCVYMIGKKKRGYTIPSVFLFVKGHMSKVQGTAFPYGGSGGASGALCPFIDDPHPDCYCVDMDSMKISLLLRYCRENYRQCEVYQKILRERTSWQRPGQG